MTVSLAEKNPVALIIEDNEDVAHICRIALEQAGFEVEVAEDGRTALERLATTAPVLILLDLHLPYVSGYQILHHIHTQEYALKPQVVLATADLLRAEKMQNEVDFVLLKPFGFIKLYELAKKLRCTSTGL
ncbi:MAG: response regulator [Anaerolineales bacterium]|nr:response regulator [Anaerolineales bacterium]